MTRKRRSAPRSARTAAAVSSGDASSEMSDLEIRVGLRRERREHRRDERRRSHAGSSATTLGGRRQRLRRHASRGDSSANSGAVVSLPGSTDSSRRAIVTPMRERSCRPLAASSTSVRRADDGPGIDQQRLVAATPGIPGSMPARSSAAIARPSRGRHVAATGGLPRRRRLDLMAPALEPGRIPREVGGAVGAHHDVAVAAEHHRDRWRRAQRGRQPRDDAVLEPMQQPARRQEAECAVECAARSPRSRSRPGARRAARRLRARRPRRGTRPAARLDRARHAGAGQERDARGGGHSATHGAPRAPRCRSPARRSRTRRRSDRRIK